MNKPLILLVVGLIILGLSLLDYTRQAPAPLQEQVQIMPSNLNPRSESLKYVPADTVLFLGGLDPVALADAVPLSGAGTQWTTTEDLQSEIDQLGIQDAPEALRMLIGLFVEYSKGLDNLPQLVETLGLPDPIDSAFYTVGIVPVWRAKLEDPDAFTAFVARAEKNAGVTAESQSLRDIRFSAYSFDDPSGEHPNGMHLIIGVHEGFGVVTFATPVDRERTLALALGLDKPSTSLADTDRLQSIVARHHFHPAMLGYLSHRDIVDGLTRAGGNEFGRMIDLIAAMAPSEPSPGTPAPDAGTASDPLATIRSPECRSELMAIAENWPRTVVGYTRMETQDKPFHIDSRIVVESNDSAFMEDLRTLRGHIPAHFSSDAPPALGVAVGLNTDALVPFLNKVWSELGQMSFQCAPLQSLHRQLIGNQPAATLAMMSGMVAGLRGISLSVLDLDIHMADGAPQPEVRALDALLTISANDPRSLLMTATSMAPPLAGLHIPDDGRPVMLPVPVPLPNGGMPMAAIKGKHIVVYVGPLAEAVATGLSEESLAANGLYSMTIDFDKYLSVLANALPQQVLAGQQAAFMPPEDFAARVLMSFSPDDVGMVFETSMTLP